jgi:hypothetical protein
VVVVAVPDIQLLEAMEALEAVAVEQLELPPAVLGIIPVLRAAVVPPWHKQISQVVMAEPTQVVVVAVGVIIT